MLSNLAELLWRRNTQTERRLGRMSCFIEKQAALRLTHTLMDLGAPNNIWSTVYKKENNSSSSRQIFL